MIKMCIVWQCPLPARRSLKVTRNKSAAPSYITYANTGDGFNGNEDFLGCEEIYERFSSINKNYCNLYFYPPYYFVFSCERARARTTMQLRIDVCIYSKSIYCCRCVLRLTAESKRLNVFYSYLVNCHKRLLLLFKHRFANVPGADDITTEPHTQRN